MIAERGILRRENERRGRDYREARGLSSRKYEKGGREKRLGLCSSFGCREKRKGAEEDDSIKDKSPIGY